MGKRLNKYIGLALGTWAALGWFSGGTIPSPYSVIHSVTINQGPANERLANRMAADRGWGAGQQQCLDSLWTEESAGTWSPTVTNPQSGAYGIPQSLPGGKMASAGPDWQTNPATQIRWGLDYIAATYHNPCGAWAFERSHYPNWY